MTESKPPKKRRPRKKGAGEVVSAEDSTSTPPTSRYWEKPSGLPDSPADWIDPEPDLRGMLSADRIQQYVDLVRLIDPFDPKNLKPASYKLTLGPNYQFAGVNGVLTDDDPSLVIPANSIVFASMQERIRLPHYIAARFNLAIDHIYRGLLLGTGPQVDPGFQGVLSCPLHNISNQTILIPLGEHLATIDFIKTTPFAESSTKTLKEIQSEEDLYLRERELIGVGGRDHRLFEESKKWKRPIIGYRPGPGDVIVKSSVAELATSVGNFRKLLRWGGIGTVVGALGLFLALVGIMVTLYGDLKDDIRAREETIERLRQSVQARDGEQRELENQVRKLILDSKSRR